MTEVKKTKTKSTRSTKAKKQPELLLDIEGSQPELEPVTPLIPVSVNLSHYISNVDKNVYAISGLPEEFIATLFAWVSRSPKSFKQHLEEALRDQDVATSLGSFRTLDEKAKAFHEKWTIGYGHSCYDADTEVLTKDGFKNWSEVDYTDELASINPITMELEYQVPVRLIAESYTGQMYRVDRNRVDMLVTPNHKIFAWPRHKIKEFKTRQYQLIEAQDLKDKCYKVKLGGLHWSGDMIDTLYNYPIEPLLQLFGFFIGDGYVDKRMKHAIQFHLKKERKISYLYSLCEQLGLTISANKNHKFYITSPNKDIGDIMSKCYDENNEKIIPSELFELDSILLTQLFDGLMNSDGSSDHRNGSMVYDTTSKKLADQIQHLVLLLGWSAYLKLERPAQQENHKDGWRLFITTTLLESMVNKVQYDIFDEWMVYDGMVYCAELAEHHTLIVRRNGRVHVSGNSVSEHASVHVGIEEISRLASAELALANDFLSITEYSQRYQKPVRGAWVNPLQPNQPLYEEVEAFYAEAFHAFEALIESLYSYRCEEEGVDSKQKGKRQNELQKLAYEDARYVLPLAMHTQLGMTANARAWRDALSNLGASIYPESQGLAKDLKEEISKVTPVLLKHATPSAYQVNSPKRLALQERVELKAANSDQTVRLLATETEENVLRKLTALLYLQYQDHGYTDALYHTSVFQNTTDHQAWLNLALHELGEHDMAPSIFKHVTYQASLLISEANWHQLLRHNRQTDFTYGNPSVHHGYVIPPKIVEAKQANLVKEIVQASENLYNKLEEVYGKQVSSYVVTNAHRRPIAMTFSLWEAYHLINLRTSSEAQWEIKDTMEGLYRQLLTVHPTLMQQAKRRE